MALLTGTRAVLMSVSDTGARQATVVRLSEVMACEVRSTGASRWYITPHESESSSGETQ